MSRAHLETITPKVENDIVRIGGKSTTSIGDCRSDSFFQGATLGAPLEDGKPPQMTGSALILRGNTEQDVRDFLESDIYAKEGVWNVAKASIIPVSKLSATEVTADELRVVQDSNKEPQLIYNSVGLIYWRSLLST